MHQLGTLYKYDLLSASQCCMQRRLCNTCTQPVIDVNEQPMFFSTASEVVRIFFRKYFISSNSVLKSF